MKKIVSVFLAVIVLCSLCACGNSVNNTSEEELKAQIADLKKENEELKQQIQTLQNATNTISDNAGTEVPDENKDETITVSLGNSFDVGEIMTITLNSSEWCEEILPSNTSGVYSYYKDVEGEKYFIVHGEIKNLSGESIDIQYAGQAEMLINGKYKLSAKMETEESDGTSFYGSVKPLQTLPLIIYASASDELYEMCKDVKVTLSLVIDEEKLGYFYDEEYPHSTFAITLTK